MLGSSLILIPIASAYLIDDGSCSEVENRSSLLLVALKKDLVSLHSGLQRAVSFKMQVFVRCRHWAV